MNQAKVTHGAEASSKEADDSLVICPCFEITLGSLKQVIKQNPDLTYEKFLNQTDAGGKCTACMLDLEHYFVSTTNKAIVKKGSKLVKDNLSFKQRFYKAIDAIVPMTPFKLNNILPVIVRRNVEQNVIVSNYSLMYEGKISGSPMNVEVIVRNSEGKLRHRKKYYLGQEQTIRVNVSNYLAADLIEGDIALGSVTIIRHAKKIGYRGTTRPQIQISGPNGECMVHGQAASRVQKGGFSCLYRPLEDRIFISVLNAGNKALPFEITYPLNPNVELDQRIKDSFVVPPNGAKLYEVKLEGSQHVEFENKPLIMSWHSMGLRKAHVICADRELHSFSVDHL